MQFSCKTLTGLKIILLGLGCLGSMPARGATIYTMTGSFAGSAPNWYVASSWTPTGGPPTTGDTANVTYAYSTGSTTQSNIIQGTTTTTILNNLNIENTVASGNNVFRMTANGVSGTLIVDSGAGAASTSTWATGWIVAPSSTLGATGLQVMQNGNSGTLQLNNNLLITNIASGANGYGTANASSIHSVVLLGSCRITGAGNITIKADSAGKDVGVRLGGVADNDSTFVGNWIVDGPTSQLAVGRDNFGAAGNGVQLKSGGVMNLSNVPSALTTWTRPLSGTGSVKELATGLTIGTGGSLGISGFGSTADQLAFSGGALTLGANSVLNLSGIFDPGIYTIVTNTGAILNTFGTVNGMPAGGSLSYNTNSIILTVPEPGSFALIGLGAALICDRRRGWRQ